MSTRRYAGKRPQLRLGKLLLAAEAAAELIAVKCIVMALPPDRYRQLLSGPESWPHPSLTSDDIRAVSWAVQGVAKRASPFFNLNCLPQALAVQRMLMRRGVKGTIHWGATRQQGVFRAHAWLKLDGKIVIGDLPDLDSYRSFGAIAPGSGGGLRKRFRGLFGPEDGR